MNTLRTLLSTGILLAASLFAQAADRIAVWDPEHATQSSRFILDTEYLRQIAAVLKDAGLEVERLTARQIADPATFNAERFAALVLEGDAFPACDITAYQDFLKQGGVLMALHAESPFEIKIEQAKDGVWKLSPENPKFAWQTTAIHKPLGMQFDHVMDMYMAGVRHAPTALLKSYLPDAPELRRPLPNRWMKPTDGAFYALVRSQTVDGNADYTPQIYIAANGPARAIIAADRLFTTDQDPKAWPCGRQTVVALTRIALDLRAGKIDLSKLEPIRVATEPVRPACLMMRLPEGQAEPEHRKPLKRWGAFDGARQELAAPLAAGKSLTVAADARTGEVPGGLEAGASLRLPDVAAGQYLRIRGAYDANGGGLCVKAGGKVAWNEQFNYGSSSEDMNVGFRYAGVPIEFTRIVYLPEAGPLELANPGTTTLYFDALQLEDRAQPAPTVWMGLHSGTALAYDGKTALTPEHLKDLTVFRCTSRPWWVGKPDDPEAWTRFEKHVDRCVALHPRLQLLLEGTPEWAAISAQRWKEGGDRRHMVPPDTAKFKALTEHIVERYKDHVFAWEIWNEENIRHFWQGTPEEFSALYREIVPSIRRIDPGAPIIIGGFAGTTVSAIDPYASSLVRSGIAADADLFAFHAYAANGLWDMTASLFEGHLLALGCSTELYIDEQGFDLAKCSEEQQAHWTDIGMARLMACGFAKVCNFQSGGEKGGFGYIDENGNLRPAWHVFADYLKLAQDDARRLDLSMTAPDGAPLQGVYAAAAQTAAGDRVTLILNPAEVTQLTAARDAAVLAGRPLLTKADASAWNTFFGKTTWQDDQPTIAVAADKQYAGFFRKLTVDPSVLKTLTIDVTACEGKWQLLLKAAGKSITALDEEKPGRHTVDLSALPAGPQELEISFRAGKSLTLGSVQFPELKELPTAEAIPVVVRFALPQAGEWKAEATCGGKPVQSTLSVQGTQARATVALPGRTVVVLRRAP